MNLLFAIDKKCIFLLQNCLFSISKCGGAKQYDVYILHTDLSLGEQEEIRNTTTDSMCVHFVDVPKEMFRDFPVSKRYPEQIYYRLAAAYLLPKDLDRILYLDVDIIVINSLQKLYYSDFAGNWFMGCTNTKAFLTKMNQIRLGMDLEQDVPYINTGVLMMNLSLMRNNLHLSDIKAYAEEKRKALVLPDQDILTALYGDKVKLLDHLIYNLNDRTIVIHNTDPQNEKIDLEWVRKNSVIIHYYGKLKPWKKGYVGILDLLYKEMIEERMQKTRNAI